MPAGVPHHVAAVDGYGDPLAAEQLLGDVAEAGIAGEAGDEGARLLHQGGVVALFAVELPALQPGGHPRVELLAVALHLRGGEQLPENQESEGLEVVELLFAELHGYPFASAAASRPLSIFRNTGPDCKPGPRPSRVAAPSGWQASQRTRRES